MRKVGGHGPWFERMYDHVGMAKQLNATERIAAAQASGVAEHCTLHGKISREQALADIAQTLERVEPGRRQLVLSDAAAAYVQTGGERYACEVACAELLRDAGADLELAGLATPASDRPPIGMVNPQ